MAESVEWNFACNVNLVVRKLRTSFELTCLKEDFLGRRFIFRHSHPREEDILFKDKQKPPCCQIEEQQCKIQASLK